MEKIKSTTQNGQDSFKSAHILSEFSKILLSIGNEMDNSVSLFDKIGEKNETFIKFEQSLQSPINSLIDMHNITKEGIYNFVYNNFVNIFRKHKDRFNFIHVGKTDFSDIVFFISTKDDDMKEVLSKNEFEYATGDLSQYLNLSFCFIEADMEKDLRNTDKIDLTNE
ncbi:MAG: hypothetical protein ACX93I_10930 [Winogradskyella sp.]